jgi:hypothetical protein
MFDPDVSTTYPAKKQHLELSELEEPLLHQHGGSLSDSFCPRGPVAIVFYFAQLGLYEDAPVLPWYFLKIHRIDVLKRPLGRIGCKGFLTSNIMHKRIAPAVIHPLIHFQLSTNPKGYTEKIRYGPQARP